MALFRITPAPTFQAEVALVVPGQAEPFKLTVTFRHHGKKAFDAMVEAAAAREKAGEPLEPAEWIAKLVVDWGPEVVDTRDEPVPFSVANLATLLDNYPAAFYEFNAAYGRALVEARAKN